MSDITFRLARLGEDHAIQEFINQHFDMRLPLLNRPELYQYYYVGQDGVPQFAVAELDVQSKHQKRTIPEPHIFFYKAVNKAALADAHGLFCCKCASIKLRGVNLWIIPIPHRCCRP